MALVELKRDERIDAEGAAPSPSAPIPATMLPPLTRRMLAPALAASVLIALARGSGALLAFAALLVMAWTMPPDAVGSVWTAWSLALLGGTLATLNQGALAVRELTHARATGRERDAAGFVRNARRTVRRAGALALLGGLVLLAASGLRSDAGDVPIPGEAGLPSVLALAFALLAVPCLAWVQLHGGLGVALDRAVAGQVPRALLSPVGLLGTLGALFVLDIEPTAPLLLAGLAAAALVAALLQGLWLRSAIAPLLRDPGGSGDAREWIRAGIRLTPTRVLGENLRALLIVPAAAAMGAAGTGAAVDAAGPGLADPGGGAAHLAVAFGIAAPLLFALASVEMGFAPKVSAAHARGDASDRDALLAASTASKLAILLPVCAPLAWMAGSLLDLFGPDYHAARGALLWLLLLPLARALFGPVELALQIAGRRDTLLVLSMISLLALPLAAWVGARLGGAEGAAMLLALAYAVSRACGWLACRSRAGLDPAGFSLARRTFARGRIGGRGAGTHP